MPSPPLGDGQHPGEPDPQGSDLSLVLDTCCITDNTLDPWTRRTTVAKLTKLYVFRATSPLERKRLVTSVVVT